MTVELNEPQTDFAKCLNYRPQPELMKLVFNWVGGLPAAPVPVIDLAAGYGIEARELALKGIVCTCQDADWAMIQNAVSKVGYGKAEELEGHPENHFGGALLKDTWVCLSPNQRQKMLQSLKRILVPGGSLLISSEIQTTFVISFSPGILLVSDNHYYSCQTLSELEVYYSQLHEAKDFIQSIAYKSTVDDTRAIATKSGFNFQLLKQYGESDPLSYESRWFQEPKPGFIAVLTKK